MNERIKKLAEQAKIEFTYDPTETPMRAFVECWEDELEKFGELIVQECANVAVDFSNNLQSLNDKEIRSHVSRVGDRIKDQFGVTV